MKAHSHLSTYMRSHPDYRMESRFLAGVDCFVAGRKVSVFKQLTPVSAQSLDVLIVCLAQLPLQRPVHGPVARECALLIIQTPSWSHSRSSSTWQSTTSTSSSSSALSCPPIQPLPHLLRLWKHKSLILNNLGLMEEFEDWNVLCIVHTFWESERSFFNNLMNRVLKFYEGLMHDNNAMKKFISIFLW